MQRTLIVGAGIFGLSTALALRAKGHAVQVLDPGPIPHPLASSTDLSKVIRPDYGADALYTDWMLEALPRWQAWSDRLPRPLYHPTGVAFLAEEPGVAGTFEADSARLLAERGLAVEALDAAAIAARFPQWRAGRFRGGHFHRHGGWIEAGEAVAALAAEAVHAGARIEAGRAALAVHDDGLGVDTAAGPLRADTVIVAAGAWTPALVPESAALMAPVAQDVFLLRPDDPAAWGDARHPVFGADISRSGWYGFPIHPTGLLKIAHHGPGRREDPAGPRETPAARVATLRAFLADALPGLVRAPLAETRVCFYCDTFDGDFLVDRSPARPGLVVVAGGSGHGLKFAPVLGDLVAAVLDDAPHPARARLSWRVPGPPRQEDARQRLLG
ncbi:MAG: FAD-dependent oxidoreductase [bacterium]